MDYEKCLQYFFVQKTTRKRKKSKTQEGKEKWNITKTNITDAKSQNAWVQHFSRTQTCYLEAAYFLEWILIQEN